MQHSRADKPRQFPAYGGPSGHDFASVPHRSGFGAPWEQPVATRASRCPVGLLTRVAVTLQTAKADPRFPQTNQTKVREAEPTARCTLARPGGSGLLAALRKEQQQRCCRSLDRPNSLLAWTMAASCCVQQGPGGSGQLRSQQQAAGWGRDDICRQAASPHCGASELSLPPGSLPSPPSPSCCGAPPAPRHATIIRCAA